MPTETAEGSGNYGALEYSCVRINSGNRRCHLDAYTLDFL